MDVAELYADSRNFLKYTNAELFDIDYDEVKKIQLHHFHNRFHEMRKKIKVLNIFANDIGQQDVSNFDDLANIALSHKIYKSYRFSDLENARFDRMTKWFQYFTAHDLSGIDASGCTNIDMWLDLVEAKTPLRPGVSSGTSGKISLWPRSTEEMTFFFESVLRMFSPYKDEHTVDFRSGKVPFFSAYPASTGRPGMLLQMKMMRERIFGGRQDMTTTLRDYHISTQELWLSAKLRLADRLGKKPDLTPEEEELRKRMLTPEQQEALWDGFIDKLVVAQKGKTIMYMGAWIQIYQIAKACQTRGIKIEWAPDSLIFTGGGTKGYTFPDGWMETIKESFGPYYPKCFREGYSMSETTSSMAACSAENHLHPLPWGMIHVADPKTGRPLPRTGIQQGRLLAFDLLPDTYWAGTATGDYVTVNWEGGCSCGRQGPYLHNDVRRVMDHLGEDVVVCPAKPDEFERLEEHLSELETL